MHDFTETDRQQILVTVALVNQELGKIEFDIKHKMERADLLRKLIRAADDVLGTAEPTLDIGPVHVPSVVHETPVIMPSEVSAGPKTAAQKAKMVLETHGTAMSVDDIYAYLNVNGLVEGRNQLEALRTALRGHPSVFRKVESGVYALTAWGAGVT